MRLIAGAWFAAQDYAGALPIALFAQDILSLPKGVVFEQILVRETRP